MMAHRVIIFEVISETQLVVERAETKITDNIVIRSIVDVILESVSVLEDAFAEVAVILVAGSLFHVVLQC